MEWIISMLVLAVAVFATAYLLPGVEIKSFVSAIFVAILLSLVNATIKPILQFISFPITILTLGLFLLVINALMVKIVDWVIPGFKVKNFGWAILFSIVLSVISSILGWIF